MKVKIYSRPAIEELLKEGFPENTAVISFYDPKSPRNIKNYAPVDFSGKCEKVFSVGIHDIDIEILKDYGLTFDTYLPQAEEIAEFVMQAEREGLDIICQCAYGQSRSAACAAAILEFFEGSGITVFADYRYYPNQLIFNKVLDALKRKGAEQGKKRIV